MDEKLRRLMKHEGINSTRLAEILGIQASGISHIMSGRNKPSYDFLTKLLNRFPQINPDWLLLDKGPMYRDEIKNKSGATGASAGVGAVSGMAGLGAGTHANPGSGTGSGGTAGVVADTTNSGMAGATSVGTGAGIYKGMTGDGGSVGSRFGNSSPATTGTTATGTIEAPERTAGSQNYGGNLFGGQQGGIVATAAASGSSVADNDDLIPSMPPHTLQPSHPQLSMSPTHNVSAQHLPATGNFTRSGAIERIVVFYKDKTFSEYQPE